MICLVCYRFLQLKLKRLKEEREHNFKPKERVKKEEETDQLNEPERNSRHEVAGRSTSGEDSADVGDRSFNESNSKPTQNPWNRVRNGDKPGLKIEPLPDRTGLKAEKDKPAELFKSVAQSKVSRKVESSRTKKQGNVSAAEKPILGKSEPLIKILEMVRSHKNGSLFERRLRSQVLF